MVIENIKKVLIENKNKLEEDFKVKEIGIFGSYIRGKQKKDSDIDILIEPPKGIGFEFAGIQLELEDKLKRKIDLITYKYISPYLKDKILKEEIRIL